MSGMTMYSYTINNRVLRARSLDGLFIRVARACGGNAYSSHLSHWSPDGEERTYAITVLRYLRRHRCSEIVSEQFVTISA